MTDNERKELLLKAKPILFNTEMVRAILDGRKTVTRRVLKNQDSTAFDYDYNYDTDGAARSVDLICDNGNNGLWAMTNKIPYFENDILYVRETFMHLSCGYCMTNAETDTHCLHAKENGGCYVYKANNYIDDPIWQPSIHMPKEAARIFLRVTKVRVERLQDITPEQIDAEGCKEYAYSAETGELLPSRPTWFSIVWDNTIKKSDLDKYGWAANPWVWVIEFERIESEN